MDRVKVLTLRGERTCYLLGTAHISKASVADVKEVIREVKPTAVVLELCRARSGLLSLSEERIQDESHLSVEGLRKNGLFQTCYLSFLNAVSKDLEVLPGQDFRTARQEALELCPRARVILGDRPVTVTLRRFWGSLGFFSKVRLCCWLILGSFTKVSMEEIEDLKDEDTLTKAIKEMGQKFPSLVRVLIEERDLYLASSIHTATLEHDIVVAVVGAGHVPGICDAWEAADDIDRRDLLVLPEETAPIHKHWHVLALLSGLAISFAAIRRLQIGGRSMMTLRERLSGCKSRDLLDIFLNV